MQPETEDPHRLDFIRDTEIPKEKTFIEKMRSPAGVVFLILCVLALITLITVPIIASQRANQAQINKLNGLAQTQTEIIRVTVIAESQAKGSSAKNRAEEIGVSVDTTLNEVKSSLQSRKSGEVDFNAKKNSQTDSELISAIQQDKFDETFNQIIDEQLLNYQSELLDALQKANKKEKEFLQSAYDKTNDLLGLVDEVDQP